MTFTHNDPGHKDYRKGLRQSQTSAETVMWNELRAGKLDGVKFRRQFGIGPYILDFYSANTRIAVELDGEYHQEGHQPRYDEDRSSYLRTLDIFVIRFLNRQVLEELQACLNTIRIEIERRQNARNPAPLSPM